MSTPEESIARLKARANPLVKSFLQRGELQLSAFIERHIDEKGPSPDAFSSSKRIGAQSGAISRALIPNGPGHVGRYDVPSGEGLSRAPASLTFGIDHAKVPHAAYQEFGARIPITEKSKGYFWARYRETGAEKWRNMALTRKDSFRLPPRPFYEPGIREYEAKQMPIAAAKLREDLVAAFNGGVL